MVVSAVTTSMAAKTLLCLAKLAPFPFFFRFLAFGPYLDVMQPLHAQVHQTNYVLVATVRHGKPLELTKPSPPPVRAPHRRSMPNVAVPCLTAAVTGCTTDHLSTQIDALGCVILLNMHRA